MRRRFTWEHRALDMLFQIKYQPVVLHANGCSLITKCFLRELSSYLILFHVFNINLFISLRKAGDSLLCCCTAFVSLPRGVGLCADVQKQRSRASGGCPELATSSPGARGGCRDMQCVSLQPGQSLTWVGDVQHLPFLSLLLTPLFFLLLLSGL